MKLREDRDNGIQWSGMDVTKAPIIGTILIKPIPEIGAKASKANVVELVEDGEIYITDKWYKDGVPAIIHKNMVSKFIPTNIKTESKKMKISELTELIKEVLLKEMQPDKGPKEEEDTDVYTADINDKKFKADRAIERAKTKIDKVKAKIDAINKTIDAKFKDYKAGKIDQSKYVPFYKEQQAKRSELEKERNSLETELHKLL